MKEKLQNFNFIYVILFISILAMIISFISFYKTINSDKKTSPKPIENIPQHAFRNAFQSYIKDSDNITNDLKPLVNESCLKNIDTSTIPLTSQFITKEDAEKTFVNKKNANTQLFLDPEYADAKYLSISDAKNEYLSKTEATGFFNGINEDLNDKYLTKSDANNYLPKSEAMSTYLPISDAINYLTKSDANNYLQKSEAMSTYLPISDANNYLQKSEASNYLSKTDAMSTYLPKSEASNYLQKSEASNYLPKSDASNYLPKSEAMSTYLQKSEASNYLPKSEASNYLPKSEASNYLTKSEASNYLQKSEAGTIYLPRSEAGTTYLPRSEAGTTYLKQSDAGTTYLTKTDATGAFANIRSSMTGALADVKSSITGAFANGFISRFCMTGPQGTTCISQGELSQLKVNSFDTDPKPSVFFKRAKTTDGTINIVFNDFILYNNDPDILGNGNTSKVLMNVRTFVSNGIYQQGQQVSADGKYIKLYTRKSFITSYPEDPKDPWDRWTPWELVNSDNYLSKTDAMSNYLPKSDAASTYLPKSDAASTYLPKSEASNYMKLNDNYSLWFSDWYYDKGEKPLLSDGKYLYTATNSAAQGSCGTVKFKKSDTLNSQKLCPYNTNLPA